MKLSRSQLFAALARIKPPILEGLAESELDTVLAAARQCQFPAGAVLYSQETPADRMFLLITGRARFFILTPQGRKVLLLWLPAGEVFGVGAMRRDPSEYLVSTEILRDSTLLVWSRPAIRSLAMRFPRLLDNALRTSAEYLTFYVATHIALACSNAEQRLASVLIDLARNIGRAVPGGIELQVNNGELAQVSNVTHFTASRLISQWQKQGSLVKSRGRILLRAQGKLLLNENHTVKQGATRGH